MFIHPVDTNPVHQGSVYEAVYTAPLQTGAKPLTQVASNSLDGVFLPDAPAPAAAVAADHADNAAGQALALWRSSGRAAFDRQARVLLKFVDSDAGTPAQTSLMTGLALLLATLTVAFSARIFGGTSGRVSS